MEKTPAKNLFELRKARGLSQAALGRAVFPETSADQVSKHESGERPLTVDWVRRYAQAMHCRPSEIDPMLVDEVVLRQAPQAASGASDNFVPFRHNHGHTIHEVISPEGEAKITTDEKMDAKQLQRLIEGLQRRLEIMRDEG